MPDLLWLRAGCAPALPDGVVRPSADEIGGLLAECAAADVRVVPRGGGTSVTGGVNVLAGDRPVVVVDLERLDGLLDLVASEPELLPDPGRGRFKLGSGRLAVLEPPAPVLAPAGGRLYQ